MRLILLMGIALACHLHAESLSFHGEVTSHWSSLRSGIELFGREYAGAVYVRLRVKKEDQAAFAGQAWFDPAFDDTVTVVCYGQAMRHLITVPFHQWPKGSGKWSATVHPDAFLIISRLDQLPESLSEAVTNKRLALVPQDPVAIHKFLNAQSPDGLSVYVSYLVNMLTDSRQVSIPEIDGGDCITEAINQELGDSASQLLGAIACHADDLSAPFKSRDPQEWYAWIDRLHKRKADIQPGVNARKAGALISSVYTPDIYKSVLAGDGKTLLYAVIHNGELLVCLKYSIDHQEVVIHRVPFTEIDKIGFAWAPGYWGIFEKRKKPEVADDDYVVSRLLRWDIKQEKIDIKCMNWSSHESINKAFGSNFTGSVSADGLACLWTDHKVAVLSMATSKVFTNRFIPYWQDAWGIDHIGGRCAIWRPDKYTYYLAYMNHGSPLLTHIEDYRSVSRLVDLNNGVPYRHHAWRFHIRLNGNDKHCHAVWINHSNNGDILWTRCYDRNLNPVGPAYQLSNRLFGLSELMAYKKSFLTSWIEQRGLDYHYVIQALGPEGPVSDPQTLVTHPQLRSNPGIAITDDGRIQVMYGLTGSSGRKQQTELRLLTLSDEMLEKNMTR